jgi:hypothetical protein
MQELEINVEVLFPFYATLQKGHAKSKPIMFSAFGICIEQIHV